MADVILNYLSWAIPSGGVGAAIAWVVARKAKRADIDKKAHDAYKTMYEDLGKELVKLQESNLETNEKVNIFSSEIALLRRELSRLNKAIKGIDVCSYRDNCPVVAELSLTKRDDISKAKRTKRAKNHNDANHNNADSAVCGSRLGGDDVDG